MNTMLRIFTLIILLISSQLSFSQSACNAPSSVSDLFLSDSTLWTIAESNENGRGIYTYNLNSSSWAYYGQDKASTITVSSTGIPYFIDENHDLYQKSGGNWVKIQQDVSSVAASYNGNQIWVLKNEQLMTFGGNQWVEYPCPKMDVVDLEVINTDDVYALERSGTIFKLNDVNWQTFGTKKAVEISSTNNSTLYLSTEIVNPAVPNLKKCFNNAEWFPVTITGSKIRRGNDQNLYYIDAFGRLMKKSETETVEITRSYLKLNAANNIAYTLNPNYADTLTGETSLFAAVRNNDVVSMYTFLTAGANINHKNFKQETPLILATKLGRDKIAKKLAEISSWKPSLSPNFEIKDKYGKNALAYAVDQQNIDLARVYIQRGANPQSMNYLTQIIYYPANSIVKKDFITLFLQKGVKAEAQSLVKLIQLRHDNRFYQIADHNSSSHLTKENFNTYLQEALAIENIEMAKYCINKGGDANLLAPYALQKEDKDLMVFCLEKGAKSNPFMEYAITKSDMDFMVLCIEKYGADKNVALKKSCLEAKYEFAVKSLDLGADPNVPMIDMIKRKDYNYVSMLLERGADAKKPNYISEAVQVKSMDIVKLLLEKGADPNNGITRAVRVQSLELVQLLLPLCDKSRNQGLLIEASSRNSKEILMLILSNGAIAQDGLFEAVKHKKTANVSVLIEYGAKINDEKFMYEAVKNVDLPMVQLLFQNGANINTGYELAVKKNAASIVDYMLENGADGYSNKEYLLIAVRNNFTATFLVMVKHNVPLNVTDDYGNTILHISCKKAYYQLTKMIIQTKQVDINAYNNSGETCLMHVVTSSAKDLNFCMLLVENGADVNAKNKHGERIRKMAKGIKVKKYLKSKGAKKK